MRLAKAKKGTKPGKDQSIKACPYCGQDILVSQGESKKAAKMGGFELAMFGVGVLIVIMLFLILQGGVA